MERDNVKVVHRVKGGLSNGILEVGRGFGKTRKTKKFCFFFFSSVNTLPILLVTPEKENVNCDVSSTLRGGGGCIIFDL
jgi:hypothetical protein